MAAPLKVGLAGLGTVGSAVLQLLERGRDKLIARCGRGIEVVAISARSRSKKRSFDLSKLRWISDPAALARDDVREEAPACRVSLSSRVLPVIREYPRLSTTALDAYVVVTVTTGMLTCGNSLIGSATNDAMPVIASATKMATVAQ